MSADLGPFFHTADPNYAIPANAIGPRCSDPPEESCSDAGCPAHGHDERDDAELWDAEEDDDL